MYMRDQNSGLPGNGAPKIASIAGSADERDREADAVADRQSHPGQQVVDERVAEVALEQREQQDRSPTSQVSSRGSAERAGEEHAHEVQGDRGDEDVRGPVVGLADQQPGLDGERDVDDRPVGVAHRVAVERRVGPVVDGLGRARVEEERQVDARRDQDDERVQRDLAEQERPVVGEQVAQALAQ